MQIELRVKCFDADWSGQIVFLLLFSNKKRVFYCPSVLQTHREAGCRVELELWALAPVFWKKKKKKRRSGWAERERGGIKDCAGICQKPIIILVQERSTISEWRINITLLWVWEYIQDSSNWLFLMLQWQFHLPGPWQQLLFNYCGCVWIGKKRKTARHMDIYLT